MSAYAGYNNTKTSDDSGGFFAGGSSQQSATGGKSYQDESLRPVTIKQILSAEEAFAGADFKIDNATITQITFVGQVRSVNPQPTNVTLKLDDGTGQVEVKKWIDADKHEDEATARAEYELDSFVRVWGRLKSFNSKKHVGAHVIRPVASYDEVNYHLLEAAYVHLFFTRGPLGQQQQQQQNGNGDDANGGGMFVDAGGSAAMSKVAGCSAAAKKMFAHLQNAPAGVNEGVHLNVITNGTGLSVREVLTASDELLGQGLIYPTVDDETWAILEY